MPLQYLKDTNCCSLLPSGGATVEKGRRKIPGNCKSEKKDRQGKKNLMNFDDSANDELEFEK